MIKKPRFTYNLAVYKIRDIEIKDPMLEDKFYKLEKGCSYVGMEIISNIGNSKNICNIIACGDAIMEKPNFFFFLPDSFQPSMIEYKIDKITTDNAYEFDDLDEIDYELLANIQKDSYRSKILDHFIITDIAQKYGNLAEMHFKSKEIVDRVRKQIDDESEKQIHHKDTGIKVDNNSLTSDQVIDKLDSIYRTNKRAFSSIIDLINSISN